jgi:hypothetical protein
METYFEQLFGLYFIITGLVVLVRGKSMIPTVKEFSKNLPLLLVFSVIEIIAGLALVLSYPQVSFSVTGIISVIGYMMVVEGIIYLAGPSRFIQKFVKAFNKRWCYIGGGVATLVVGLFLAATGFGFL